GGYYTFILAKAVGPDGTVYAQNTPRGLNFEEDRQDITQGEALENKILRGNLDNVVHLVQRLEEIELPAQSLDAVIVAQVLHDYYNPNPERALAMLEHIYSLLKPGGVAGVMDHVGLAGNDNRALHRMRIEDAVAVAEAAGFRVESSDLLRNPNDLHARSIFDPRLNRNTDRFLLKLTRPE
ncbi:MAG: methyltransferase domain-containing protein, partial [Pseudohongiellaceae bacterium]